MIQDKMKLLMGMDNVKCSDCVSRTLHQGRVKVMGGRGLFERWSLSSAFPGSAFLEGKL